MHWPLPLPLRPRSPLSPRAESNPFSSDRPKKKKKSKSSEYLYTWSPITTITLLLGVGDFFFLTIHRDSLSDDSGSSLRISESILSLVFNQMYDDAELAL